MLPFLFPPMESCCRLFSADDFLSARILLLSVENNMRLTDKPSEIKKQIISKEK